LPAGEGAGGRVGTGEQRIGCPGEYGVDVHRFLGCNEPVVVAVPLLELAQIATGLPPFVKCNLTVVVGVQQLEPRRQSLGGELARSVDDRPLVQFVFRRCAGAAGSSDCVSGALPAMRSCMRETK